ncbi:hypothetical protein BGZ94_007601 [Podila epigama]|nr:hypothetical protein BGZ94_007601 [Podila epigama]
MTLRKRNILCCTIAIATLSLLSSTHAQAQGPVGSRRMGYAQMDDKLFIQGGFNTSTSDQFFALDLATSWTDQTAAWTRLRSGQSTAHLSLTTISSDMSGGPKGSILATGGMEASNFFSIYDINSNVWTPVTGLKPPYADLEGHAAVTDPETGIVYLVGGYNGTTIFNILTAYNPVTKTIVSQEPGTLASSLIDTGAVWSIKRKTILTFGGSRANPSSPKAIDSPFINEYNPVSKTWTVMTTSGDSPPSRLDHCMATNTDGSKVVVFGGTDGDNFFDDIYILDVDKATWKKGTPAAQTRTRLACAIHSAQLIAWGGSSGSNRNTMHDNLPIIYNINKDKWVNNYDASLSFSSSNLGSIIGGLAAVLVVGGLAGFFFYKKRKARREANMYHSDTATATAMGPNEIDDAIKVPYDDDHHSSPHYGNNGNDYPLSKMDVNDPYTSDAARNPYWNGNQDPTMTGAATGAGYNQHTGSYPNYTGGYSETMTSPGQSHYCPGQPIQSPAATYQPGQYSDVNQSSTSFSGSNPFDDHHRQQQQQQLQHQQGSASPGSNPFSTTPAGSPMVHNQHLPPTTPEQQRMYIQQLTQDPFEHQPEPKPTSFAQPQVYANYSAYAAANGSTMSPRPGARAPQVIPEAGQTPMGYVPPPSVP